ncbi:MAG TPA: GNAT family N-acetyltransferase [Bacteroidales bacterium]|nr:GNAT family N-acetyltransferase [Bacteroidales bacterium]
MENTHIRKASHADIETIAQFQAEMAMETESLTLNPAILRQGVKAVLDDESKGTYYVFEVDNRIISSLLITYEWSDWRNSTVYWLQSVYVLKEFRRRGIFSHLYEFVKDLAVNDNGVAGIRLYVDKTNLKAQKAYENAGMNGSHYTTFEWMKRF